MLTAMLTDLLSKIDQHREWRAAQGRPIAESTLGRLAVNDGKLIDRLRDGRQLTVARAEAVEGWLKQDRKNEAARQERAA